MPIRVTLSLKGCTSCDVCQPQAYRLLDIFLPQIVSVLDEPTEVDGNAGPFCLPGICANAICLEASRTHTLLRV
ncbi:unnamed protein product [Protopolystoma xenopodis]|uniref:Uncharacterized protein n=1 Tax=Protopolystoma xenopodis TaxID=117903 RepID=A0A448XQ52_9PLAT|nr:unnamed protein product [Protopolystoma xenopodis]